MTPGHLHQVALEAADTALLQAPAGHAADGAGYTAAPTASERAVTGARFITGRAGAAELTVGDEGVSPTERSSPGPDGTRVATDLSRSCAAMLSRPDGGRRLIGGDGRTVDVEPAVYGVEPSAMAVIDAAVPPVAVVPLPPRRQPPRMGRAPTSGATSTRPAAGGCFGLLALALSGFLWGAPPC
ncbi:hypothetical protein ACFV19_19250 [Streptomyces griseoluteus]|uniref:hypothetical protein n=1 Tax=Streptomyces griseoluteus TaxID=29306 RepID=UPI00369531BE